MQINEINIRKYGKFNKFSLQFKEGFNIVYGANEAGKSTIHSFIKAMFYGLKSGGGGSDGKKIQASERVRYMPWDAADMGGSLVFSHEGEGVLIQRIFKKTQSADTVSVTKAVTGDSIDIKGNESIGEVLFGIPEGMFEKTLWIKQSGTYMGGSDEEITKRLINMVHTGDEDVSHESAVSKLMNEEKALKARDGRGARGVIDVLQAEREELLAAKLRLEKKQQTLKDYEEQSKRLKERTAESIKQINNYKKLREVSEIWDIEKRLTDVRKNRARIEELKNSDEYKKYIGVSDELKEDIRNKNFLLEQYTHEMEKLQDSSDLDGRLTGYYKKAGIGYAVTAIGTLTAVLSAVWYAAAQLNGIIPVIVLGLVVTFFGTMNIRRNNSEARGVKQRLSLLDENKAKRFEEIKEIKTQVDAIYASLDVKSYAELLDKCAAAQGIEMEIKLIRDNISSVLGDEKEEELEARIESAKISAPMVGKKMTREEIDSKLNELQAEYAGDLEKLKDISRDINMLFANEPSIADVQTHLEKNDEDMLDASKQLSAVVMAREYVEKAFSDMQSDFGPKLNEKVNEVIYRLTDGRYRELKVSEKYSVSVMTDGSLRSGEYLSDGTYDQIYFALRMGIIGLVCQNRGILFLDDTFIQYDDNRLAEAMSFINQLSADMQVIMFTCQKRDVEAAKKLGNVKVINI